MDSHNDLKSYAACSVLPACAVPGPNGVCHASDPGLMAQAGAAVSYPGLPSHPQHMLLQRLANPGYGFGGLLTLARSPAFSSLLPGMCRLACSLAVTADACSYKARRICSCRPSSGWQSWQHALVRQADSTLALLEQSLG